MKTKYYEITGETGLGYTVSGRWNYREQKWLFGEADDRHDGTGTTFETLEAAENELPLAQDTDVQNINIYSVIVEEDEDEN
jgi:hypothetical protein